MTPVAPSALGAALGASGRCAAPTVAAQSEPCEPKAQAADASPLSVTAHCGNPFHAQDPRATASIRHPGRVGPVRRRMRDHTRRGPRRSRAGGRRVRHAADGSGCSGRAARVGRRCSHAAGVARAAAAIRHRHQGRQEDRWRTDDLAEGRQGLDRADARGLRQADVVRAQDRTRHRRGGAVRRHDDRSVRPLRPTSSWSSSSACTTWCSCWRATPSSRRATRHPRRAPSKPASRPACWARPRWRASRIRSARSILIEAEQPVHHRHAGRGHRAAAAVPPGLRVRRPQHVVHARCAASPTRWCSRSMRTTRRSASPCRSRACPPGAGAVDPAGGARCAQPVPRLALLAGQAARAADGGAPGRPARGLLRHRAPGLQRRPGAHAARAPRSTAGAWRRRIRRRRCPSR